MIDVVNKSDGTAKEFDLSDYGYQIAAKTGTAQISENGQYSQTYKDAIHSVMVLAPEKIQNIYSTWLSSNPQNCLTVIFNQQ